MPRFIELWIGFCRHARGGNKYKEARATARNFLFDAAKSFSSGERPWLAKTVYKVRDGEGAIASTRGACAPQTLLRPTR